MDYEIRRNIYVSPLLFRVPEDRTNGILTLPKLAVRRFERAAIPEEIGRRTQTARQFA